VKRVLLSRVPIFSLMSAVDLYGPAELLKITFCSYTGKRWLWRIDSRSISNSDSKVPRKDSSGSISI
jgi:hypothetical protein